MFCLGFGYFESQLIYALSLTFTDLILTELLVVALSIKTKHGFMILAEIISNDITFYHFFF